MRTGPLVQALQECQLQGVRRRVGVLLPQEDHIGLCESVQQGILGDRLAGARVGNRQIADGWCRHGVRGGQQKTEREG